MIVAAGWLAGHLDDPELRVCDCRWYLGEPERGRAAYLEGHIPGAIFVDLDRDLSATEGPGRHPLPAPRTFAERVGELGIGPEHTVVAYDDRGGAVAARLWWMLGALGHGRVFVLDGGLDAWTNAGGATATDVAAYRATRYPTDLVAWPGVLDRLHVEREIGRRTLIDARAPERFRGESEPIDAAAGHIPGAVNIPYEGNLGPDGRMRSPTELRARYAGADRPIVYCGSGVTACHDILAMELAGLGRATLYPGSWSDWSASGGVIETG